MTYLQLVNAVLVRLREAQVTSVASTPYSLLIGQLINDTKKETELAYTWNALSQTFIVNTVASTFSYAMTGAKQDFVLIDATNNTSRQMLQYMPTTQMTEKLLTADGEGAPRHYNFNGIDSDGDMLVDIYPIPDGVYQLLFNVCLPQETLTNDSDVISVPFLPVILGAYWRAVAERGEDGGINSDVAFRMYMNALGDAIAIDANKFPEELIWTAV